MKKRLWFLSGNVTGFVIGVIVAGGIGIAVAENIASSSVDYNKNSQATVEDALDDLYEKSENCSSSSNTEKLVEHIVSLYNNDGTNNLYFHDKVGTYATYEAGDASYRYSGSNSSVENYVCFGSDADTCPSDNLYRIIGLFKDSNNEYQAKLIKATAADSSMLGTNGAYYSSTTYYWTSASNKSNAWGRSELNTINLNTNYVAYLNAINSKWMDYIDAHTWKVGGNTSSYIISTTGAQYVYSKEIDIPAEYTTYSDEIGLMYVSDYMYGASPAYWNKMGYNKSASYDMRAANGSNWLYLGSYEWTITRRSDTSSSAFGVTCDGGSVNNYLVYSSTFAVRPVFYLKPDVSYAGGSGTSDDPYRISG